MVIGLAAALLSAVLFGAGAVVQAIAARHHGLISWLMASVVLVYLVGWALHLVAIVRLPLYLAQVGIAVSLVVTALIASRVVHEPLERVHWLAVGALVGGLVLLVAAAGPVGTHAFGAGTTLALYGSWVLLLLLGLAAMRLPVDRGGPLLGVLGGLAFSGSPIASRSLVGFTWDPATIAPALTIGMFGLLGFWLYSVALRRTTVTAATAPLVLLETLVPAVVGVVAFGDGVRAGWWPVGVLGFAMSAVGAVVLAGAEARLEHLDQAQGLEPAPEAERQPG